MYGFIFERYLGKHLYQAIAIVALMLLGITMIIELSTIFDKVGHGQFTYWTALENVAYRLVALFYDMLPIAVLIGAIFALSGLANRSEFVIFRNAGVSIVFLMKSLGKIGLPIVIGYALLGELMVPWTELRSEKLTLQSKASTANPTIQSSVWIREQIPLDGTRYLYANAYKWDKKLYDVSVYQFDKNGILNQSLSAKSATLKNNQWTLFDVRQKRLDGVSTDQLHKSHTNITALKLQTNYQTHFIENGLIAPKYLSIRQLLGMMQYNKRNQLNNRIYFSSLCRKIMQPLTVWVMLALSIPFAYSQNRQGGQPEKIILGILLGVSYFIVNQVFTNLTILGQWPVWITTIMPSVIYGGIAMWFIGQIHAPFARMNHVAVGSSTVN